ncbi:hypothetical protein BC835DRAFT_390751 [Cytidiella melzeri]|nr:hypothetical protein BC835DRAFT_390751 [Cytidiella melzeri]
MDSSGRRDCLHELDMELRSSEDSRNAALKHFAELDDLIRLVHPKKASLAPANTLPDEILAMVLEEACVHNFSFCCHYGEYKMEQSVIISHVSRRWRNLALALPQIWQCIHITDLGPSQYDKVVELFLARSREAPLSIVVFDHSKSYAGDVEHEELALRVVNRCWALLCTAAPRWTFGSFWWNNRDVMKKLLQAEISCVQLPNLRSLQFNFEPFNGDDYWPANAGQCWNAVHLTHLLVSRTFLPLSSPSLSNVVVLSIRRHNIGIGFLADISNAAPRLTTLILYEVVVEGDGGDEPRMLFPFLRRLALSCYFNDTGLSCFEAPLLEMLWLDTLSFGNAFFDTIRILPSPNYTAPIAHLMQADHTSHRP